MELQLRIKEKYQHKQRDETGRNVWKIQVKSSHTEGISRGWMQNLHILSRLCLSSSWKNIAWITRKISSSSKKRANSFHENKREKKRRKKRERNSTISVLIVIYSIVWLFRARKKNYEKKTGQTAWNGIKYYQIHWRPQQGSVFVDSVSRRATFI